MSLTRRCIFLTLILLLQSGSLSSLSAQETGPKLTIGAAAPTWNDLMGTDDKKHSLEQLRDKQVVIVCFTCNSCPYAVDYENRMIALQLARASVRTHATGDGFAARGGSIGSQK